MTEAAAIIAGFKWLATELLNTGYSYLGLDMDMNEKLQNLRNVIIPQIEMLMEDAEKSRHKDRLRGWLKSLEDAVYEAEDVLDLHDYYLLQQKVKSSAGGIKVRFESLPLIKYLSKKFSVSPQSIELKKSLVKLENIAAKAKEFRPFLTAESSNVSFSQTTNESGWRVTSRSQTTNESGRRVTTSKIAHKVFGRDEERDFIVNLLHETPGIQPESSVVKCYSVVAIVGIGGAGKTTLARYVYDYEKDADPKYFDVFMWVHVSQIFDAEKLTKEMIESSGGNCADIKNYDTLQTKLEDSLKLEDPLKSKKFLLVLDDVWRDKKVTEEDWERLLAPLSVGYRGSKILITTREKGVADTLGARNIPIKELEENKFLSLLEYYAFGAVKIDDDELHKKLKGIVKEKAQKLHGSPLAARMVGSQLRRKVEEFSEVVDVVNFWNSILSGDLLKDTRKSLLWSYQNLDPPLRRCFSYCSLFSKGYKIECKYLIHLWIAEGFIKTADKSKKIEDVGQEYFDDLLSSSFFQPTEKEGFYNIHDLLHDLAEMDSKDRCFRVEENLTVEIPQAIRHLSLYIKKK